MVNSKQNPDRIAELNVDVKLDGCAMSMVLFQRQVFTLQALAQYAGALIHCFKVRFSLRFLAKF